MARGEATQVKCHYKGKEDDFVVFLDDVQAAKNWKTDKSIPLPQFISAFKIFVTGKHGVQGEMNGASNSTLDNEFGTHKEEEVIVQILEKGTIQESKDAERTGSKNDSMGARSAH